MDAKYLGVACAVCAIAVGILWVNSAAVERKLMQAFSQSTAAQRLAVLYTQGTLQCRCGGWNRTLGGL